MNKENLITAIDKASKNFKLIKEKYQGINGYLVFSSPYGQCGLTDDLLKILVEFPAMINESEHKGKVIKQLETMQELETQLKNVSPGKLKEEIQHKIKKASLILNTNLSKIDFTEDTFIEVRFGKQDLTKCIMPEMDLIFKMQKDPLVSRVHTPQTMASIRIVLGTLIELAQ